jgi:hypothetical protein
MKVARAWYASRSVNQPGTGEFVGRRSELAALREALDAALAGRGSLTVLVGEPGIGKTRLAEEIATHARRAKAHVLWGRAWEGGGAPALWPWVQILRGWLESRDPEELRAELGATGGAVAHLLPELLERVPGLAVPPLPEGEAGRFRLLDVVVSLLARVSRTRALVLVLDDLHWADAPSLELLNLLAGRVAAAPILVLATVRDTDVGRHDERSRLFARLAREGASNLLQGFSAEDVEALVAHTAGFDPPPSLVAAVLERSDGNPLFVREIVRLLAADRALGARGTQRRWAQQIPAGIQETIRRRIEQLPPRCAAVLARAAVLGREFELRVLDRMRDGADPVPIEEIDAAVAARLVAPVASAPGVLRFAHALVRETLLADLPAAERARLHRAAGEALEDVHRTHLEPRLAELAHHFLAAADRGERALPYAVAAAQRAIELRAYEEAARLYEQALAALALVPERSAGEAAVQRTELLLAFADARSMASDDRRARDAYLEVAKEADRLGLAGPLARAALGAGGRGDMSGVPDPQLIALLERALVVLGPSAPALRSRVLSRLSGALTLIPGTRERRMELTEEAIRAAEDSRDADALALALVSRHLVLYGPGHLQDRLAVSERLLRLVRAEGSREALAIGLLWRGMALLEAGEIQAGDENAQEFAAVAGELRQPSYQVHAAEWRAMRALLDGRLAEAEPLIAAMLAAGAHADPLNTQVRYVSQMFVLRREQGRLAEVADAVLALAAAVPAMPSVRAAAALAALETGREGEARTHFEFLARDDFASLPRDVTWAGAMAQLARVCAALSDARRAGLLYELLLPDAERNLVIGFICACEGSAGCFLGMLAAVQERYADAALHFEAGLAMNARMGARPALAHAQREYAAMLLRRNAPGDGARAAALLADAMRTYAELGMQSYLERAAALARPAEGTATASNVLRREGDSWLVGYAGASFRLNDAKGLHYIARLLRDPERELHVVDLAGAADLRETDATPAPDPQARLAYRRRLEDLREQLEEAEGFGDLGRTAALQEEVDAIAGELAAAYGLRGVRARGGAERVRKAVTKCIRDQIAKIGRADEALGRHLENAIRTGTFCAYLPERSIDWEL